ncbi:MAG: apolipoprotein N-acyltransferase, partial [Thermoplasmata archaeon M9B2D]
MSSFGKKQASSFSYLIISLFSGLSLSFAFPKYDFFFLAWFSMVPFLWVLTEHSEKTVFKAGIVFGLGFFFGTQYWIYHSINHYGHLHFTVSILIVFLLCLYESLYVAIFALFTNLVVRRSKLPVVLIAPALWVCTEYLRGIVITGFPWSFLAHSQYKLLPFIQIADISGAYGISFLIVGLNSIIVDFLLLRKRRKKIPLYPAFPTYVGSLMVVLLTAFSLFYGYIRMGDQASDHSIKVSVIQGNIEQDKKWDPDYQNSVFETYLNLTRSASNVSPDLIVWPETAVPFFFGTDRELTDRLIAFQRENRIPLFLGSVMVRPLAARKYRLTNSAILLDKDGNTIGSYDKIHLVPFGEYVPLRNILFFIDKMVEGVGDYVSGSEHTIFKAPFGNFAPAICYELVFPSLIRSFFLKGGNFLVTITNDAWFGA